MKSNNLFLDLELIEDAERSYYELLKGNTLFRELHSLVRSGDLPVDSVRLIELCWLSLDEDKRTQEARRQWTIACDIVRCAELAAKYVSGKKDAQPAFQSDKIEDIIREIRLSDEFDGEPPEKINWASGCIDAFLRTPFRSIQIHAAVEMEDKSGMIANLLLELVSPGNGRIMHHPGDDIVSQFDLEFLSSMGHAWQAARKLARNKDVTSDFDGRWRLLLDNGEPLSLRVDGGSASGAAARGWYYALMGSLPNAKKDCAADPRVIVLAAINDKEEIIDVGGIDAKIKAIVADRRIDTIVVVSTDNKNEIIKAQCGKLVDIPSIPPNKEEPWWTYRVPLSDGRIMKVVLLNS